MLSPLSLLSFSHSLSRYAMSLLIFFSLHFLILFFSFWLFHVVQLKIVLSLLIKFISDVKQIRLLVFVNREREREMNVVVGVKSVKLK